MAREACRKRQREGAERCRNNVRPGGNHAGDDNVPSVRRNDDATRVVLTPTVECPVNEVVAIDGNRPGEE